MAKGDGMQAKEAASTMGAGSGGACGSNGLLCGSRGVTWEFRQVRSRYRGWKECKRVTGQEAASCDRVG